MLVLESAEDLELSGRRQDLLALAAICFSGHNGELPLKAKQSSAALDSSVLVFFEAGPIVVRLQGTNVIMRGAERKLSLLGENIAFLANQQPSRDQLKPHLHIEYIPGHAYLDETSEPLVLTLLPTD
jgi:hypothetical protein